LKIKDSKIEKTSFKQ